MKAGLRYLMHFCAIVLVSLTFGCSVDSLKSPQIEAPTKINPVLATLNGRVEVDKGELAKAPSIVPMAKIGVAGATVELLVGGQVTASTTTTIDGAWEITGVTPGTYTVRAWYETSAGLLSITSDGVALVAGQSIDIGTLTLALTGAISGSVELNDTGDWSDVNVFIPGSSFVARTGVDGQFTLLYVPRGVWKVRAAKSGYSSVTVTGVTVQPGLVTKINDTLVLLEIDSGLDSDGDGVADLVDNCPAAKNPLQGDNDYDNLGDVCDLDDDNDQFTDVREVECNTDPLKNSSVPLDTDNDGICNYLDADDDGDGFDDTLESSCHKNPLVASSVPIDTDSDGLCNFLDQDDDNDSLFDTWEIANGYNALVSDAATDKDGDGLSGLQESALGTKGNVWDTDGDTLSDGSEVAGLTNPLLADTDSDGFDDNNDIFPLDIAEWLDTDLDGIGNNADIDDDNDGLPDFWEAANGYQALVSDATTDLDNDGLTGTDEYLLGTRGNLADTDADLMPDGWEIDNNLNPLINDATADADGDGKTNLQEYQTGTNPQNAPPTIGGLSIGSGPFYTLDTISSTVTGVADLDGDNVTLSYQWVKNGIPLVVTGTSLAGSNFVKGDLVRVLVRGWDGKEWGSYTSINNVVIQNTAPTFTSVDLSAGPYTTGTDIVATSNGWSDDDGDPPGYKYTWFVNGVSVPVYTNSITGGWYQRSNLVKVSVRPYDGSAIGDAKTSTEILISNAPPEITSLVFTPSFFYPGITAEVAATSFDPDGDAVTISYQWFINSSFVTGATSVTFSTNVMSAGETISVSAQPNDGYVLGLTQNIAGLIDGANSIAVAQTHVCMVMYDGRLYCWGSNSFGALGDGTTNDHFSRTRVGVESNWNQATVGGYDTCAINDIGQLYCWGKIFSSLLPSDVSVGGLWVQVDLGWDHGCAIRNDGALFCWGDPNRGAIPGVYSSIPAQVEGMTDWKQVSAGDSHTCAVKTGGTLYCWGNNFQGQLGDGTTTNRNTLTKIGADTDWDLVFAGDGNTCAKKTNGNLYCWGSNYWGKVGDGSTQNRLTPVLIGTPITWETVGGGKSNFCGISTNKALYCWGDNSYGQVDKARATPVTEPIQIGSDNNWVEIGDAGGTICGVKNDGAVFCWGGNTPTGIIGNGTSSKNYTPIQIGKDTDWQSVSVGNYHTCALKGTGELRCWGSNRDGGTGDPLVGSYSKISTHALGVSDWLDIDVGQSYSCGLKNSGSIYCWGTNSEGQLGDGTNQNSVSPVSVTTSQIWIKISQSAYGSTCALNTSHELFCWGRGYGAPSKIGLSTDWSQVDTGANHTCGLKIDGALFCWGGNTYGQIGDGSAITRISPLQIGSALDWVTLSTGGYHTCAINTNGQLYCWGSNTYGQIGDGSTTTRFIPTQVGSGIPWKSVSAGYLNTCALSQSNQLYCWGINNSGESGSSLMSAHVLTPKRVIEDSDWMRISAANDHACGIKNNGQLFCWGNGSYYGLIFQEPTLAIPLPLK